MTLILNEMKDLELIARFKKHFSSSRFWLSATLVKRFTNSALSPMTFPSTSHQSWIGILCEIPPLLLERVQFDFQ
jgi:hypothetical protein